MSINSKNIKSIYDIIVKIFLALNSHFKVRYSFSQHSEFSFWNPHCLTYPHASRSSFDLSASCIRSSLRYASVLVFSHFLPYTGCTGSRHSRVRKKADTIIWHNVQKQLFSPGCLCFYPLSPLSYQSLLYFNKAMIDIIKALIDITYSKIKILFSINPESLFPISHFFPIRFTSPLLAFKTCLFPSFSIYWMYRLLHQPSTYERSLQWD